MPIFLSLYEEKMTGIVILNKTGKYYLLVSYWETIVPGSLMFSSVF